MINGYSNITNQRNPVGADNIRPRDLYHSTDTHPANYILNSGELTPQSRLTPSQLPYRGTQIDSAANPNLPISQKCIFDNIYLVTHQCKNKKTYPTENRG